jgi:hypothetical protein
MTMLFCLSRNDGRRCTRERGHRGLHRSRTLMWTDAGADAPECSGSGAVAEPAQPLPDGFPGGRALCPVCLRFIPLDSHGLLEAHDASAHADDQDAERRAEWFNTFGWP